MKTLLLTLSILLLAGPAMAQQYVQGYTRSNGTYVQGYYRSTADGNPYNNYSTRGNVNPYTGQPGYVNPNRYSFPMNRPRYGGGYNSSSSYEMPIR